MDDAALDGGCREGGADRVLEPAQSVAAGDQDVADPAVAQVGHHAAPEAGALAGGRRIGVLVTVLSPAAIGPRSQVVGRLLGHDHAESGVGVHPNLTSGP